MPTPCSDKFFTVIVTKGLVYNIAILDVGVYEPRDWFESVRRYFGHQSAIVPKSSLAVDRAIEANGWVLAFSDEGIAWMTFREANGTASVGDPIKEIPN